MFALAGVGLASACDSSEAEALRRAKLAEGCLVNSDCSSPLVCAFQRCHTECVDERDCELEQLCVPSEKPFRVCLLADEGKCAFHTDCPGPLLCFFGYCRLECKTDKDCVSGQDCVEGGCADPKELVSGALPKVDAGADSSAGTPCVYTSQCEPPLVCKTGSCVKECLADIDCAPGWSCNGDGRCVADAGSDGGPGGCANGVEDPGEEDVDCGGSCGACAGKPCTKPSDCASHVCASQSCQAPSCSDGLQNGTESDVDCGGASCGKCPVKKGCWTSLDCQSGQCNAGTCTSPGCTDGQQNTNETDVDCGGPDCAACAVGKKCAVNTDCTSGNCVNGACKAAGPTNWVRTVNSYGSDELLVTTDGTGHVFVAGSFSSEVSFGGAPLKPAGQDVVLAKYTAAGAHVWSFHHGGASSDAPFALALDGKGDLFVTGSTFAGGSFGGPALSCDNAAFAAKYSGQTGAHVWSRCIDVVGAGQTDARAGAVDDKGDFVIGGQFSGLLDLGGGVTLTATYPSAFVAKLSGVTGDTVWAKVYKEVGTGYAFTDVLGLAGGAGAVYAVGSFTNDVDFGGKTLSAAPPASVKDAFLLKLGPDGATQLAVRYGGAAEDAALSVAVHDSQHLVVTGYFGSQADFGGGGPLQSAGGDDVFVLRASQSTLATSWVKGFGTSTGERPAWIAAAPSGEVAVTGWMKAAINFGGGPLPFVGSDDVFLVRLAANGTHVGSQSWGGLGTDRGLGVAYLGNALALSAVYSPNALIDFGGTLLPNAVGEDGFFGLLLP